ncbi:MAG: DUF2497 domain-containing protein [Rhodospirillales bacterium]
MADTAGKPEPHEPSMEDILASIRRILAEDGGLAPDVRSVAPPPPQRASRAAEAPRPVPAEEEEDEMAAAEPADDPATVAALAAELFPSHPPSEPSPSAAPAPRRLPLLAEDVLMLSPDMRAGNHKLVSTQAADESTDVLSQLARAILDRRDIAVGARTITLEDMVREMLRPLLREWLDRNLPYLIERLVKKEIDLMINRAERLED